MLLAVAALTAVALVLLLASTALAAGPAQPVVELQCNTAGQTTHWNQFSSTPIKGTDGGTMQQYKFQRQREGKNFSYAIAGLTPSSMYAVEMSFVEHDFSSAGSRVFNIYMQGTKVQSKLDIYALMGKDRALQRTYTVSADSRGVLVVLLRSDESGCKDYATVSTLRVYTGSGTAVEIDTTRNRNNMSMPIRHTDDTGQDTYEALLGRMGSRQSLDLLPQRLSSRFTTLGTGTGDLGEMVLALKEGAEVRALPTTDRFPIWETLKQWQSMTAVAYTCASPSMGLTSTVTFRAPYYPSNDKLSRAPFIYMDVSLTNPTAAPISGTFLVAMPHKRLWSETALTTFSDGTKTGVTYQTPYQYFDETYNPSNNRTATEALAVPTSELAGMEFKGLSGPDFANFTGDTLWGWTSPDGYPQTYNDPKDPIFSYYPRGYTGAFWSTGDIAPGATVTRHYVLAGYLPNQVLSVSNSSYTDGDFRFKYLGDYTDGVAGVLDYAIADRDAGDNIMEKCNFFDNTVASDAYLKMDASYAGALRDQLGYAFQSFLTNTWWVHSGAGRDWFSVWEGTSCRFHSTVDVEYNDAWFYFAFAPQRLKQIMDEWVLYQKQNTRGYYLSHDMGVGDVVDGQAYSHDMPVEEDANYVLLLYRYWKSTGDSSYMRTHYSYVRKFVDFMANCDTNNNGLPDLDVANTLDQGSAGIQNAKDQAYLGVKCLGAYRAAQEMAMNLSPPDNGYAAKAGGQVELINQTLQYDLWLSDHFAVCLDGDVKPEDQSAYSIYANNGLVYPLSGSRDPGVTSGNLARFAQDLQTATTMTLKSFGCTHSSFNQYNEWISQNQWRDQAASQLGVSLNGDSPLALSSRYWDALRYFGQNLNGGWWDVVLYPGGSGARGASAKSDKGPDIQTVAPGSDATPGSARGASGYTGADGSAGYGQSLGYYPRGTAGLGLIDAAAGLTLDVPAGTLYYKPVSAPLRVPVFARADWANADPAQRVPTLNFNSVNGTATITNPGLLPGTVGKRNTQDLTNVAAGGHAVSPDGDGVNDSVTVQYHLPLQALVQSSIWDGASRKKIMPAATRAAGSYSFPWDGKDSGGKVVDDGLYTARIDSVSSDPAASIHPASQPVWVNRTVPNLGKDWYLAEGYTGKNATGGEFDTYVLLQNPNPGAVTADVTFMMPGGQTVKRSYPLGGNSRFTIHVDDILPAAEVSTYVHASGNIAAERAMYFSGRKAGHDSIGVNQPGTEWYLPEGYTAEGFDEYVLIQNPGNTTAQATATFMVEESGNQTRQYTVAPHSRFTIHVDDIIPAAGVSTKVTSTQPVVVERAQYLNHMTAGTCSIGARSPSRTWFLAEGYTADGFEEWVLLQNPGDIANDIIVTYMDRSGKNTIKRYQLLPRSRYTVNVGSILPGVEVSVRVRGEYPLLVERAMYWNGRSDGHDCIGTPSPDTAWYLPEGYTAEGYETWVLVQNPGDTAVTAVFTFMEPSGRNTTASFAVAPRSRFTVNVASFVPSAQVSTKVTADAPIIVERAVYFNNRSGGTDSLGIRGY